MTLPGAFKKDLSFHTLLPPLPTLQHLLRRLHNPLDLRASPLNDLLHRRPGLLQLIRPRRLPQLQRPQLLLLLRARLLDRRRGLVACFRGLGSRGFARFCCGRRDVEDEEEGVGACWVGLGREGEGAGLDG